MVVCRFVEGDPAVAWLAGDLLICPTDGRETSARRIGAVHALTERDDPFNADLDEEDWAEREAEREPEPEPVAGDTLIGLLRSGQMPVFQSEIDALLARLDRGEKMQPEGRRRGRHGAGRPNGPSWPRRSLAMAAGRRRESCAKSTTSAHRRACT